MDNTSLDDFLDDGEDGEDADSDGDDADSDGAVPAESDGEVAEREPPTSRWRPDGAACPVCGDPTTRFWHDDGQFVCASCKEWG